MRAFIKINGLYQDDNKKIFKKIMDHVKSALGISSNAYVGYNMDIEDVFEKIELGTENKVTSFLLANYNSLPDANEGILYSKVTTYPNNAIANTRLKTSFYPARIGNSTRILEVTYVTSDNTTSIKQNAKVINNVTITEPGSYEVHSNLVHFLNHVIEVYNIGLPVADQLALDPVITPHTVNPDKTLKFKTDIEAKVNYSTVLEKTLENGMTAITIKLSVTFNHINLGILEFPLTVRNTPIDTSLISFDSFYTTDDSKLEIEQPLQKLGSKFITYRGIPSNTLVKSPPIDTFDIPKVEEYQPVACILLKLDSTKPRTYGNLFTLPDFKILPPYDDYLKDNIQSVLDTKNLCYIKLFQDEDPVANVSINNTGNLTSTTNIDLDKQYRLIIYIRTDLSKLTDAVKTAIYNKLSPTANSFVTANKHKDSNLLTYDLPEHDKELRYKVDSYGNITTPDSDLSFTNGSSYAEFTDVTHYSEWYPATSVKTIADVNDNYVLIEDPKEYETGTLPTPVDLEWILYKGSYFHKTIANYKNNPVTPYTSAFDTIASRCKVYTDNKGFKVYIWDTVNTINLPTYTPDTSGLLKWFKKLNVTTSKDLRDTNNQWTIINDKLYKVTSYKLYKNFTPIETEIKVHTDTTLVQPNMPALYFFNNKLILHFGKDDPIAVMEVTPITDAQELKDRKLDNISNLLKKSRSMTRILANKLNDIVIGSEPTNGWYQMAFSGVHDYVYSMLEWNDYDSIFKIHRSVMDYEEPNTFMLDVSSSKTSLTFRKQEDDESLYLYAWDTNVFKVKNPPIANTIGNIVGKMQQLSDMKFIGLDKVIYKVKSVAIEKRPYEINNSIYFRGNTNTQMVFPNKSMIIMEKENNDVNLVIYSSMLTKLVRIVVDTTVSFSKDDIDANTIDTKKDILLLDTSLDLEHLDNSYEYGYTQLSYARFYTPKDSAKPTEQPKVVAPPVAEKEEEPKEEEEVVVPEQPDNEIWRLLKTGIRLHRSVMNKDNNPVTPEATEASSWNQDVPYIDWFGWVPNKLTKVSDFKFKYSALNHDLRSVATKVCVPANLVNTDATYPVYKVEDYQYVTVNDYFYKVIKIEVEKDGYYDRKENKLIRRLPVSYVTANTDNEGFKLEIFIGLNNPKFKLLLEPLDPADESIRRATRYNYTAIQNNLIDQNILVVNMDKTFTKVNGTLNGSNYDITEQLTNVVYRLKDVDVVRLPKYVDNEIWRKLTAITYLHRSIMNRNNIPETPEAREALRNSIPRYGYLDWYIWNISNTTATNDFVFKPKTFSTFETMIQDLCTPARLDYDNNGLKSYVVTKADKVTDYFALDDYVYRYNKITIWNKVLTETTGVVRYGDRPYYFLDTTNGKVELTIITNITGNKVVIELEPIAPGMEYKSSYGNKTALAKRDEQKVINIRNGKAFGPIVGTLDGTSYAITKRNLQAGYAIVSITEETIPSNSVTDTVVWRPYKGLRIHRGAMNKDNDPVTDYITKLDAYLAANKLPTTVKVNTNFMWYGYDNAKIGTDKYPAIFDVSAISTKLKTMSTDDYKYIYINGYGYEITSVTNVPNSTLFKLNTTDDYYLVPNSTVLYVDSTGTTLNNLYLYSNKGNLVIKLDIKPIPTSDLEDRKFANRINLVKPTEQKYFSITVNNVKLNMYTDTKVFNQGVYEVGSYEIGKLEDNRNEWVPSVENQYVLLHKYGLAPYVSSNNALNKSWTELFPKCKGFGAFWLYGIIKAQYDANPPTVTIPFNATKVNDLVDGFNAIKDDTKKFIAINGRIYQAVVTASARPLEEDSSTAKYIYNSNYPTHVYIPSQPVVTVDHDFTDTITVIIGKDKKVYSLKLTKRVNATDNLISELKDFFTANGDVKILNITTDDNRIGIFEGSDKFPPGAYSIKTTNVLTIADIPKPTLVSRENKLLFDVFNNKMIHNLRAGELIVDPSEPNDITVKHSKGTNGILKLTLSPYTPIVNGVPDKVTNVSLTIKDGEDTVYTYNQNMNGKHREEIDIQLTEQEFVNMYRGNFDKLKEFTVTGKVTGENREVIITPYKFKSFLEFTPGVITVYKSNTPRPEVDIVGYSDNGFSFLTVEKVTYKVTYKDANRDTKVIFNREFNNISKVSIVDSKEYMEDVMFTINATIKVKHLGDIVLEPMKFIKNRATIEKPTITLASISKVDDERLDINVFTSYMKVKDAGEINFKFFTTKWRITDKATSQVLYEYDVNIHGDYTIFRGKNSDIISNRDNLPFEYNKTYVIEACLVAEPMLESEWGSLEVNTGDKPEAVITKPTLEVEANFNEDTNTREFTATLDTFNFEVLNRVDQTHTATSWYFYDGSGTELFKDENSNKLTSYTFKKGDNVTELLYNRYYKVRAVVYSHDVSTEVYKWARSGTDPYTVPDRKDTVKPVAILSSKTTDSITVRCEHVGDGPIDRWEFRINGLGITGTQTFKSDAPEFTFTGLFPDNEYNITTAVYYKSGVTKGGTTFPATYTFDSEILKVVTDYKAYVNITPKEVSVNYLDNTFKDGIDWFNIKDPTLPLALQQHWELRKDSPTGELLQEATQTTPGLYWAWSKKQLPAYDTEYYVAGWLEYKHLSTDKPGPLSNKQWFNFRSARLTPTTIGTGIRSGGWVPKPNADQIPECVEWTKTFLDGRVPAAGTPYYKTSIIIDERWKPFVTDIRWYWYYPGETEFKAQTVNKFGDIWEETTKMIPYGNTIDMKTGTIYNNLAKKVKVKVTLYNGEVIWVNIW